MIGDKTYQAPTDDEPAHCGKAVIEVLKAGLLFVRDYLPHFIEFNFVSRRMVAWEVQTAFDIVLDVVVHSRFPLGCVRHDKTTPVARPLALV